MTSTSAAEYAALAKDVYSKGPSKVYSWHCQNFFGNPDNGFFAAAYQTPRSKKLVVAFRGTDEGVDWLGNLGNTFGLAALNPSSQLNTAMTYFNTVRGLFPADSVAVCGHSLGGFLATMVAMVSGVPGVAFNPAPLGVSGLSASAANALGSNGKPRVVNFRLKGDVVSGLRSYNIGTVVELELSIAELWSRGKGVLGDWDPLMHAMALMEEAILRHKKSHMPPEMWR